MNQKRDINSGETDQVRELRADQLKEEQFDGADGEKAGFGNHAE